MDTNPIFMGGLIFPVLSDMTVNIEVITRLPGFTYVTGCENVIRKQKIFSRIISTEYLLFDVIA